MGEREEVAFHEHLARKIDGETREPVLPSDIVEASVLKDIYTDALTLRLSPEQLAQMLYHPRLAAMLGEALVTAALPLVEHQDEDPAPVLPAAFYDGALAERVLHGTLDVAKFGEPEHEHRWVVEVEPVPPDTRLWVPKGTLEAFNDYRAEAMTTDAVFCAHPGCEVPPA